ncbi:uncharacterized protein LOC109803325 [Cajanus cajan]|uniref:uncharacterized protein LOC109803325 n=1 Tax=Cajanus cajan TaxID=3821 RepID=UPI00098DB5A5|nr:uncharacterized protein LOC109803325 [Cajanus cajan]
MQRKDITTFFFSRFPESYNQADLWKVFQRWGKVWDVFIAARRNRHGQRYGFVRFLEVENVKRLEKQLDEIYIGGTKLYANIPRYRRNEDVMVESQHTKKRTEGQYKGAKENKQNQEGYWRVRGQGQMNRNQQQESHRQTYAQILKGKQVWKPKSRKWRIKTYEHKQGWNGISFTMPEVNRAWLEGSWIGYLKDVTMFNKMKEAMLLNEPEEVKLRYLGDDMVLITGLEECKMQQKIKDEEDMFSTWFHSVQKWNTNLRPGNKLVWVKIIGIPLQVWNDECFAKAVAVLGEHVATAKETSSFSKLDAAKVFIRTGLNEHVN